MLSAKILGISRLRMGTDGKGITTLVGFYGCPLRCKYCLNPKSFSPDAKPETLTSRELYERVKEDDLYFVATGGGVTFGGGEPLLNTEFIAEFKEITGSRWRFTAETSLAVPKDSVRRAVGIFDEFVVDIKDTDPEIYLAYTGKENTATLSNLKIILDAVGDDRVLVRLPLIRDFNTPDNQKKSEEYLRSLGVTRFDKFTYKT